jgi:hypothetical protein
MVAEFLISQGFSETYNAVFGDSEVAPTIEKYCGAINSPDVQIDLRKKIRHFILTNKISEAAILIQENF